MTLMASHDPPTVVLSYVIAVLASYAALDLAGRVSEERGRRRRLWLLGGAFAMGLGIWSMHFTGMTAFKLLGTPIVYDVPLTLASMLPAIAAAGLALHLASRPALRPPHLVGGGLVMGAGIASMHYTGMAAMRMQAVVIYDPWWVALSLAIAVVTSIVAMSLAFRLRGESFARWSWRKAGSALVMGAAICGMHYTGMAAARFVAAVCAPPRFAIDVSALGAGAIGFTTLLVLSIALIAAYKEHLLRQMRMLARERGFSEQLIADVPAAIAYLDRDLVFRWANPTYSRMTGIPPERLLNRTVAQAFGEEADAQIGALLQGVVERGKPYHAEGFPFRYVLDDRERTTYWDFTYSPVFDEGLPGRPADGVLILATEVSERVERERLKDQFLSVLSHELRTPINAITGFGSILEDGLAGPLTPEQVKYLQKIHEGADTLLALVDDLLDMSRIQAGKFAISPQPMDFTAKACAVVETLAPAAARKAQHVTVEMPPSLPLVADELRVGQVLSNLIGNALKFGPSATEVRVSARMAGGRLRCEVTDDGEGIPPEVLPRLFQPFSQADMSLTRRQGGVGLGLSIAKALVEAHGGTIGVLSEPGRGSTFWFELPGAKPDPSATRRTDGGASFAV